MSLRHRLIPRNRGRIVSIASDAARIGTPREAVYAGAKAAIIGFSKATAHEVGLAGVTVNAYDFFRKLRREGAGEHARFFLIKGESHPGAPRTRVSFPDAQKKDRSAAARGDVPVLLFVSVVCTD